MPNSKVNMTRVIAFVTSNVNKIKEIEALAKRLLFKHQVVPVSLQLTEIQDADVENITRSKLNSAAKDLCQNYPFVMVEDSSLCCHALGGLPGPFVKYFEDAIGPEVN